MQLDEKLFWQYFYDVYRENNENSRSCVVELPDLFHLGIFFYNLLAKAILKLESRGANANVHAFFKRFPFAICFPPVIFQLRNFEVQEHFYTI